MSKSLLTSLFLILVASGCSKHKCDLGSEGKKTAFGDVAAMTKGAHSCDVEGHSAIGDFVDPNLRCEIGDKDCVANMHTIHPNMQPEAVVAQYKAFLEPAGWTVTQGTYDGTRGNGKPFKGVTMRAEKGDRFLISKVYMLADTLAEANTIAVDRATLQEHL
ncbi:MAG: hypothetical protein R3B13_14395 [Polyangiaceae bacterium]